MITGDIPTFGECPFKIGGAIMSRNVKELEEKIGYNFKDSHLLRHAVTHSSYVNEKHMKKADCNERLEFLGDAVLELISSEYLFFENQTMPEGELTKLRASMGMREGTCILCAGSGTWKLSAAWER